MVEQKENIKSEKNQKLKKKEKKKKKKKKNKKKKKKKKKKRKEQSWKREINEPRKNDKKGLVIMTRIRSQDFLITNSSSTWIYPKDTMIQLFISHLYSIMRLSVVQSRIFKWKVIHEKKKNKTKQSKIK